MFYFSDRLIKNDPYPPFYLICIWSRSVFMLRTLLREDTPNWFCDSQLLSLWGLFLPTFPLPPLLPSLSVPSPLPFSIPFSLSLPLTIFSLALHFFVVWGRILPYNLDWSWSVYTAQTGPKLSATLLSPPPGCWNHRCVQSHPGVSFLLNYYISALMHWHLSKQFYVGED